MKDQVYRIDFQVIAPPTFRFRVGVAKLLLSLVTWLLSYRLKPVKAKASVKPRERGTIPGTACVKCYRPIERADMHYFAAPNQPLCRPCWEVAGGANPVQFADPTDDLPDIARPIVKCEGCSHPIGTLEGYTIPNRKGAWCYACFVVDRQGRTMSYEDERPTLGKSPVAESFHAISLAHHIDGIISRKA